MKSLIFLTHYFFLQKALGAAFVNLLLRERFAVNDNTLVLVHLRLIPIVLNCGAIEVIIIVHCSGSVTVIIDGIKLNVIA